MHYSRMRTVLCSGYLSYACPPHYACPPATHGPPAQMPHCHAYPLPCMPTTMHTPLCHAHPNFATHAPFAMHPHPPLWTEGMTHVCENITFPQLLLRTVVMTLNQM